MNNTAQKIGQSLKLAFIGNGLNNRVVVNTIVDEDHQSSEMLEYVPSFVDTFLHGPRINMNDYEVIGFNFSQKLLSASPDEFDSADKISLMIRNSGAYIDKDKAVNLAYVVKGLIS